jgi:histidyl-tRNA synthetase
MTDIIPFKKTPIGTVDLYDASYDELKKYINYLETLFANYGGKGLETPMFEIRENLLSKYGEEAENLLIYNLADNIDNTNNTNETDLNTKEKYTLRYDLTIPKVRYIMSNNTIKDRIYSIGKVFRRDNPSLGRFREFYQADFDIIGESNTTMVNEFLLFKMVRQFISELKNNFIISEGIGSDIGLNYKIYVNFTQNLHYILIDQLKIDHLMFKKICSTIDKLDKYQFDDLKTEFKLKGLSDKQIDMLKTYLNNQMEPVDELANGMWKKLQYLISFDTELNDKIIFCPSLARGLDYYNGIIYEVKIESEINNLINAISSSIISGGRYDNLIPNTTLIGLSFGLSRIISICNKIKESIMLSKLSKSNNLDNNKNQYQTKFKWKNLYYMASMKGISFEDKIKYWNLFEKKFNRQIIVSDEENDKKLIKVITYCVMHGIKYLYVLAPDELRKQCVILKDLENKTQILIDLRTI